MGIDLHNLHSGDYPVTQNVLDLSNLVAENGIDYAVSFPMPTTVYYNPKSIRNKGLFEESGFSDYPYQYENYALCNIIEQLQLSNIIPFVSVSTQAKLQEQVESIYKLNEKFSVYGIKYHASAERMSVVDRSFEPFAKLAADLNVPILVHASLSSNAHPDNVLSLAQSYPSVRLCIAHCARFHKPTLDKIKFEKMKNIFVDTAPFVRLCNMSLENLNKNSNEVLELDYGNPYTALRELVEYLPHNIVWGTDTPWNNHINAVGNVVTYSDEASVLKTLNPKNINNIMENQLNFLFGTP